MSDNAGPVPGFASRDDCTRAREALDRGGYDTASIGERLGGANLVASRAIDVPPWLRATGEGTTRDVLIRLFLIGVNVPAGPAREQEADLPAGSGVHREIRACRKIGRPFPHGVGARIRQGFPDEEIREM